MLHVVSSDVAAQKAALRADIRARRRNRSAAERAAAASALRDVVLGLPELPAATVVAAYASTSTEPGTGPLLDALAARPGLRVLLPVQQADGGLDWAEYDASRPLVIGAHGIAEPAGPRLSSSCRRSRSIDAGTGSDKAAAAMTARWANFPREP
jgi:5-formyltetrahydrofolate cyclo-ligase